MGLHYDEIASRVRSTKVSSVRHYLQACLVELDRCVTNASQAMTFMEDADFKRTLEHVHALQSVRASISASLRQLPKISGQALTVEIEDAENAEEP